MKRHAPGCNCCNRVLIWDLGVPITPTPWITFTSAPTQTATSFVNWTATRDAFRGVGVKTDFVLGEPQPSQDFWGPIGTLDGDGTFFCPAGDWGPGIDPETDAVDLGHWSGDIFDYSLIIWRAPLSDAAPLGNQCGLVSNFSVFNDEGALPCPAMDANDSLWVAGGRPSWYDAVFSGAWRGRIVVCLTNSMNAGAIRLIDRTPDVPEPFKYMFWQSQGRCSLEFFAEDRDLHGVDFEHIAIDPRITSNNVSMAAEDDLTVGVPPFSATPPAIIPVGKSLFNAVLQVDSRAICDSTTPLPPLAFNPFSNPEFSTQTATHVAGIRKTHVKDVDGVEVRADLVVCPVPAVLLPAFAKNLVRAPLIPSDGDIL